jgi:transcriptional regulator with XRE-family HTH domain
MPVVDVVWKQLNPMEDAGQKLKQVRDRLNLTIRDVEEASRKIADRHRNDEFVIGLSRLSEIENKGTMPTIYRLYSLCAIYRLDPTEVLEWYGINLGAIAEDAFAIEIGRNHPVGFRVNEQGDLQLPIALDPGIDPRKTTYLSRLIQRWGRIPLSLLAGLDPKNRRYAFIGTEDWVMHPIIPPGALVMIDETRRRIANSGWQTEFDRPIYFFQHGHGYACGWCHLKGNDLILQPHPASPCQPETFDFEGEVDVIGQVIGVAMILDPERKRRVRS